MAARPLEVLVLALVGMLASAPAAGAARNGPIAWAQLDRRGPVIVESDSAGGPIRDLLGPSVHAGAGVFSPTGDRFAYDEEFRREVNDATLIVENFGIVPATVGEGIGREMAMYGEAVQKVGHGGHALAGAHNGG